MIFFKRLKKRSEENCAATKNTKALLAELDRTEADVDELHEVALTQLKRTEKQARRLQAADGRNHYSEGLTKSYREKLA